MLQKLIRIVEDAGEMIRCAHHIEEDITEKSSPIDVVTKYDTAVQEHLHRELLKLMPEAGFLGEEGAHEEITTEWTFIVDPIDGTANFVRNFGHSNISVALARNGVTEYGVVYNPYRGELYAAQRGKGAQNLVTVLALAQDALSQQSFSSDDLAVLKLVEGAQVDDLQGLGEDVVETALGDAAGQRHLTTFEADAGAAAGAGVLTLVAATCGLAVAGAMATALAVGFLNGAGGGRQFVRIHCVALLMLPQ